MRSVFLGEPAASGRRSTERVAERVPPSATVQQYVHGRTVVVATLQAKRIDGQAALRAASYPVNRSNKLFMAALLLVAGYAAASLLGSPIALRSSRDPVRVQAPAIAAGRAPTGGRQGEHPVVGGVRLLPDLSRVAGANDLVAHSANTLAPLPIATGAFASAGPPPLARPVTALESQAAPASSMSADAISNLSPHTAAVSAATAPPSNFARLNNSPPRPLWDSATAEQRRAPAVLGSVPTISNASASSSHSAELPGLRDSVPLIQQQSAVVNLPPAAVQASMSRDSQQALFQAVSAPPLARFEPPSRTHIVVDGDTLTKLAKRYLNDASRSEEIFTANRQLLKSPDLLPIGAELKIPAVAKASARGG